MEHVLICGVSCRAAAESAARAGFTVTAFDAFADLDQHRAVQALSVRDCNGRPTAASMARVAAHLDADAVCYLSPFENHPRAVTALSTGRSLWGNSPKTLRRVRDPFELSGALRRHGFAVPRLTNVSNVSNDSNDSNDPNASNRSCLVKPFRSGGGKRIRRWRGESVRDSEYIQEWIEGTSGSIVFLAANGRSVPIGVSRQLIGDANFGSGGYRYCGSILAPLDDPQFANGRALFDGAAALAQCVTSDFDLVGINGLDFIARDAVPYPVDLNPRWSASVEVAERAFGSSFFGAHVDACRTGQLPSFDLAASLRDGPAVGKAIVYARRNGRIGDTRWWLEDPTVRDVPRPGEFFRKGQPICSVFASAADSRTCYHALVDRARRVYADVEQPSAVPSGVTAE